MHKAVIENIRRRTGIAAAAAAAAATVYKKTHRQVWKDRNVPIAFSLIPPTGKTFPLSVTSPESAVLGLGGFLRYSESSDDAMEMPADGPSFGAAPDGTWTCTSSAAT